MRAPLVSRGDAQCVDTPDLDSGLRPLSRAVISRTLGSDFSGVIAAVGTGVVEFAPGDEVFGVTNPRSPKKPTSLTPVDAASVPLAAVTAWQTLFEEAHLERGASALIHGAAGNVGAYAVQLAHAAGLHVTATAFAREIAYVRSIGADNVIDAGSERFEDKVGNVDAVIDLVGGETQERSFTVLRTSGHLISAVSVPDQRTAMARGVTARFFLVKVTTDYLNRIAALIDEGRLRTNVTTVLPLAEAREAHEMLDGVRPRRGGKIVLSVQWR